MIIIIMKLNNNNFPFTYIKQMFLSKVIYNRETLEYITKQSILIAYNDIIYIIRY